MKRTLEGYDLQPNYLGWPEQKGDGGIRAMCGTGAKAVRDKQQDFLVFNLWNLEEAQLVKTIMAELYPEVPYTRNWIAGGPEPKEET